MAHSIPTSLLGRGSGRARRGGGCGGGCGSSGSGGCGRSGIGGLMHGARVLHEVALCGRAKVALRALKRALGAVHGELCGGEHGMKCKQTNKQAHAGMSICNIQRHENPTNTQAEKMRCVTVHFQVAVARAGETARVALERPFA